MIFIILIALVTFKNPWISSVTISTSIHLSDLCQCLRLREEGWRLSGEISAAAECWCWHCSHCTADWCSPHS